MEHGANVTLFPYPMDSLLHMASLRSSSQNQLQYLCDTEEKECVTVRDHASTPKNEVTSRYQNHGMPTNQV